MKHLVMVGCIAGVLLLCAGRQARCEDAGTAGTAGDINVKDFAQLVVDGDWSGAIQAAIDHVSAKNGYENGATIYFPPGTYRIDKTIRLGKDRAHYGMRLSGYGAVLLGTKTLDGQPLDYEQRLKALTEAADEFSLLALPGELDFNGKNVGIPILELWDPPDVQGTSAAEGASFVIEGLTFDREVGGQGVGIKIPAETVPKNITFRDIKVYGQNVGVHINHCYQIRFESCIIRGNQIGIWGRNHWNSVSIINCSIRREHLYGIVIGPNASQWGSSAIHIAGCIFEDIKGYGILNAGGNEVTIVGNYFEMVGNSIGVISPYGNTTIDTNVFLYFYEYGWKLNSYRGQVVSDKAHIIVDSPGVQLRNNKYYGEAIMAFGLGGGGSFDHRPIVAEGVKFPDGMKVADSGGLGAYVYDADTGSFELKEFSIPPEDKVLAERIRQAQKDLEAARGGTADDLAGAQMAIGDIWLSAGDFDRARQEYEKAWQYPAVGQLYLRAFIQMHIADSYMQEENYTEAVKAYSKALEIGPGGWHKGHCEENLKKAQTLAEGANL